MAKSRGKKDDEERSSKAPRGRKSSSEPITEEAQQEMDDSDSILLLKTDNYLQAQFLIGALEEEEIPFVAKRLSSTDPTRGAITHVAYDAPGSAEIYVSSEDYDRAKDLLESLEGDGIANFDDDDDEEEESEENFFEDDDER
ncbi:MAG: DUF2007 domain-containing protein [bacterium]|nr:DUF2007 domain-containing protein [bacterium]